MRREFPDYSDISSSSSEESENGEGEDEEDDEADKVTIHHGKELFRPKVVEPPFKKSRCNVSSGSRKRSFEIKETRHKRAGSSIYVFNATFNKLPALSIEIENFVSDSKESSST